MKARLSVCLLVLLAAAGCDASDSTDMSIGTPEARAALFDTVLARVERREAFSPIKNRNLGIDPLAQMRALRPALLSATTEEELFYALQRLSNARNDRHLDVALVPGGLTPGNGRGVPHLNEEEEQPALHAPIKVLPDFGTPGAVAFFVSDLPANADLLPTPAPELGDRIVSVNGRPFADYLEAVTPYHRYSAIPNFWWRTAMHFPERTGLLPDALYEDDLTLELERLDGTSISVRLPYLEPADLEWSGAADPKYEGFRLVERTGTFDLYLPESDGLDVVVLRWYGFRETLVEDMDWLIDYADREGLLHSAVIVDGTRSRGGSKGAYALQRLTPRPFRVTFGNLRLSDVIEPFIEEKVHEAATGGALDSGVTETLDDGSWLLDWLQHDVLDSLAAGAEYTNDVPFKLAHLPKDSDGMLQPAPLHFSGPLICFFGPQGGSHLDQFAAQVTDNGLGYTMGMPTGGYSNTWEWEEVLTLPGSERPLVRFMYNIGHTVRPNGTILEGEAPPVDEFIPLTRENFQTYYSILLERALDRLQRGPVA